MGVNLAGDPSTGQDSLETVADFHGGRNPLSNINSNNVSTILSNTSFSHLQTQAKLITDHSLMHATEIQHDDSYTNETLPQ